ncbi:class I SAM-dependent methyltransferase [Sinirhodobacter sp. WL0062]|uniref:Class I SAM-dependent methyltransferase n=1 Tax=Rhodobacter flavimaris TaxID=2907145 RepID=A0ABS8YU21_9RHOB|nr:class I SAM-dependent methyltransferase [Sinirhodobacter sp. WL0062]MCE5972730.1 class I SAM-dependent methyltransferase [Sinirhodobacter sp. WL0062]
MSWNERFSGTEFHYGTEPADFVRRQAWRLPPGARVLSLAEGEGRNAVYLAGLGLRVTALESAPNALAKARGLAQARGVSVDWQAVDLARFDWPEAQFDAVLACFIQFADPAFRARIFEGAARALRPGGLLLIHGFATRQPGYGSGGPGNFDHLYTLDLLRAAFPGWPILHQADYDAVLDEGAGHAGRAALVDFVASKP